MDMVTLRTFFMWCTILNGAMLVLTGLLCTFAGGWIYSVHSRFYPMSRETFNVVLYAFVGMYKILFITLNLMPYIALVILCSCGGRSDETIQTCGAGGLWAVVWLGQWAAMRSILIALGIWQAGSVEIEQGNVLQAIHLVDQLTTRMPVALAMLLVAWWMGDGLIAGVRRLGHQHDDDAVLWPFALALGLGVLGLLTLGTMAVGFMHRGCIVRPSGCWRLRRLDGCLGPGDDGKRPMGIMRNHRGG